MAFPVIKSQTPNTVPSASSISLSKPTGLSVGDLLLAFVGVYNNGSSRIVNSVPTGFEPVERSSEAQSHLSCYFKIADSGDVAASSFTFGVTGAASLLGLLLRIDTVVPAAPIADSEVDASIGGVTTNVTPAVPESLVIAAFHGSSDSAGAMTLSDYAITPSTALSELIDLQHVNGFSDGHGLGIAAGQYAGLSTITERSAVVDTGFGLNEGSESIIVVVSGPVNAAGTAALLQGTPAFFAPAASAGTFGTAALLQGSPTIFVPTASEDSPTVKWQGEDLPPTDWNREPLP